MLPYIGLGAGIGAQALGAGELSRNEPYANSVREGDLDALLDAAEARVQYTDGATQPKAVGFEEQVPKGTKAQRLQDTFFDPNKYASVVTHVDPDEYTVRYNPNSDRAYLAHELGHIVSDRNPVGKAISNARTNPMLAKAIRTAGLVAPGAVAALTPGDDDLGTSLLAAYATAAPTIADEFLASKNALALMDTAGMRASIGQRGKLAGGLLTYVTAPLAVGLLSNQVGNLMDDELVGTSPGQLSP